MTPVEILRAARAKIERPAVVVCGCISWPGGSINLAAEQHRMASLNVIADRAIEKAFRLRMFGLAIERAGQAEGTPS